MSPGWSSTRSLADRGVRRNGGYKPATAPTIPFSATSVFAYSEQCCGDLNPTQPNCRSQPAGDGVGSVNSGGEADGLIASRLAPTGDLWWLQDLRTTEIKLWEPAGDGGGSVNSGGEADGLIASKLAPTGIVALIRLSTAADTAVRRTATVSETPGADRRSVVAGAGRNRQGIAGAPRR